MPPQGKSCCARSQPRVRSYRSLLSPELADFVVEVGCRWLRTMIASWHHVERRGLAMMGRQKGDQSQLVYAFHLDDVVPADHLVRQIDAVLDLSWVHAELARHYLAICRPSIDPVLMLLS